jgi:hypothetical protein
VDCAPPVRDHGHVADERVRELERRFRQSGAIEDEVAWLEARVRAGALARRRLELAAYLGHPAARRLVDPPPEHRLETERQAESELWGFQFHHWQRPWLARACVAAVRLLLPLFDEFRVSAHFRRCIEAVEAWIVCPCEGHAALVRAASAGLRAPDLAGGEGALLIERTAALVDLSPADWEDGVDVPGRVEALGEMYDLDVDAAIRDDLIPWALDLEDPVRARALAAGDVS